MEIQGQPDIDFRSATLRELTRHEQAEFLLTERVRYEIASTDWDDEWKLKANAALELALHAHSGDTRDDKSYVTHVLRVAARVLSPHHFNIRSDPRRVIAALLHDAVEDRPESIINELPLDHSDTSDSRLNEFRGQQHRALEAIAVEFGPEVAETVAMLTNEVHDNTDMSQETKHALYRAKVVTVFEKGGSAALVKLSDFIDNCLGLEYNPDEKKRLKLAHKYQPLLPDILKFVLDTTHLAKEGKAKLIDELFYANELCNRVIESKGHNNKLGQYALNQLSATAQLTV